MQITELGTTESKLLMLIHSRIHYDNMDSVSHLLDHIEKNGYFKSDAGLVYKNALLDYYVGNAPSNCIYCGSKISEDNYLICKSCNDKLITKVVKGTKSLTDDEYDEELAETLLEKTASKNKKAMVFAIAGAAIALIALAFVLFMNSKSKDSVNTTVATSDMAGNSDATTNASTSDVSDNQEQLKEAAESGTITEPMAIDGFDFLGKPYDEIAKILGPGETVIDESTKYFKSCGVSVLINTDTGMIEYVDNDGTGNGIIEAPIFEILPGCSVEQAKSILTNKGIEIVDYSDDSFMSVFMAADNSEMAYEIDVTADSDGNVVLVAARLINK